MKWPQDPARRAALLVVAALFAALAGLLALFGRPSTAPQGMGLARLLHEESLWRRELWLAGTHINERELWEIQETLAARSGISTSGLKGLLRRAVNARDAAYQAQGHLLAGNTALAAVLAGRIADWPGQTPVERVRWLRRRADALWRGTLEDPAPDLRRALADPAGLDAALRLELCQDLASWHWHRLLFRPEDPAAEINLGLEALTTLDTLDAGLTPDQRAASRRLRGRFLLRRGCLTSARAEAALREAESAFADALSLLGTAVEKEPRASILHDLGVTRLELGDWPGAALALAQALELRDGKVAAGGRVDVRVLERQLSDRLQTLGFLALAEARIAGSARDARLHARLARGMTVPEDGGSPWIATQAALLLLARADGLTDEVERLRQEALAHYPHDQAGEPGVPARRFFEAPPAP